MYTLTDAECPSQMTMTEEHGARPLQTKKIDVISQILIDLLLLLLLLLCLHLRFLPCVLEKVLRRLRSFPLIIWCCVLR